MSVFALSRLRDLGLRRSEEVVDPGTPLEWNGLTLEEDDLQDLHEALHDLLVLLFVAGYKVEHVVLGSNDEPTAIEFRVGPRSVREAPVADLAPGLPWPLPPTLALAIPYVGRDRLVPIDLAGPLAHRLTRNWIRFDADPGSLTDTIRAEVGALRPALADAIAEAITAVPAAARVNVGFARLYDPAVWNFPRGEAGAAPEARAEALRALGEAFSARLFQSKPVLARFLDQEATPVPATRDVPPYTVLDRLRLQPSDPNDVLLALDGRESRTLGRDWIGEARTAWREAPAHDDGRPPQRRSDLRRLSYTELLLDAQEYGVLDALPPVAPPPPPPANPAPAGWPDVAWQPPAFQPAPHHVAVNVVPFVALNILTEATEVQRFFDDNPDVLVWPDMGYKLNSITLTVVANLVAGTRDRYAADLTLGWDPNATVYFNPPSSRYDAITAVNTELGGTVGEHEERYHSWFFRHYITADNVNALIDGRFSLVARAQNDPPDPANYHGPVIHFDGVALPARYIVPGAPGPADAAARIQAHLLRERFIRYLEEALAYANGLMTHWWGYGAEGLTAPYSWDREGGGPYLVADPPAAPRITDRVP